MRKNILVIKHGALGDVVLATGPMNAIRQHHKDDHIVLLTTKPYAEMLRTSPYFDEVWVDTRPKIYNPLAFIKLILKICRGKFARVYDLQTSQRSALYHFWLCPKPEWIGTARGASHRHNTPERTTLHTIERQKQQLAIAGIHNMPAPDVSWLSSDISRFQLPPYYALIVPGGSAHRPAKRWPAQQYGELCNWFISQNITPVLIGTKAEAPVLDAIKTLCPSAINLLGQTNFADIATLARNAQCAVGNDTGPIHLIVTAGAATVVLFSHESNPDLCAPRGKKVAILREKNLGALAPEAVIAQVSALL